MSKGNTFESDLLSLIFNTTTISQLAINATSSAITSISVSLHTGDPGEAGDQTTSEAAYTGYTRIAVTRSTTGWVVASGLDAIAAAPVNNDGLEPLGRVYPDDFGGKGGGRDGFFHLEKFCQPDIGGYCFPVFVVDCLVFL